MGVQRILKFSDYEWMDWRNLFGWLADVLYAAMEVELDRDTKQWHKHKAAVNALRSLSEIPTELTATEFSAVDARVRTLFGWASGQKTRSGFVARIAFTIVSIVLVMFRCGLDGCWGSRASAGPWLKELDGHITSFATQAIRAGVRAENVLDLEKKWRFMDAAQRRAEPDWLAAFESCWAINDIQNAYRSTLLPHSHEITLIQAT